MFYEGLKDVTEKGRQKWARNFHVDSSVEGLLLGGLAGGMCPASAASFLAVIYIFFLVIELGIYSAATAKAVNIVH